MAMYCFLFQAVYVYIVYCIVRSAVAKKYPHNLFSQKRRVEMKIFYGSLWRGLEITDH